MTTNELSLIDVQTDENGNTTGVIPIKSMLDDFRSCVNPTYGYSDRLLKEFIQIYVEVGLQDYYYAEDHLYRTIPKFFNKPNDNFNPIGFLRKWLDEVKVYNATATFENLKRFSKSGYLVTEQTNDGIKILLSKENMYDPNHRLLNNLDASLLRPPILRLAKAAPPATITEKMNIGNLLLEFEYMNGRYDIFLEKDIFKQPLFNYLTDSSCNLQMSYLFNWFKEVYDEYDDRITHVGNNFLAIFSDLKEFITRYKPHGETTIRLINLEITSDDILKCDYKLVPPTKSQNDAIAKE